MAWSLGEIAAEEVVAAGAAEAAEAAAAAAAADAAAADAAAAGGAAASSSFAIPAGLASVAKSFAVSFALAKLFSRDVDLASGGTSQTFLANSLSTMDPIPVVYGSRRVGASVIEVAITATEVQADRLHRVAIWGEGPIAQVASLYLDTVAYTDPGRFPAGIIGNVEHYAGTDAQAASAALIAFLGDPSKWNASCTLAGIAYTYLNLVWNPTAFPHGRPVITADIDGRTLYDPRTTLTGFSRNPALVIRDYLTNTRYGRGVPSSMIDDQSIADAAYHCDDPVNVPDGAGGTTTQARYTTDGVLNVDQPALANLQALMSSCRGFIVFSGGKYKLKVDRGYWGLTFSGGAAGVYGTVPETVAVNQAAAAKNTIEFWMKWDGTMNAGDVAMPVTNIGGASNQLWLGPTGPTFGNQIAFGTWNGDYTGVPNTGYANKLTHVVLVYENLNTSGAAHKLYLNGALQTTVTTGTLVARTAGKGFRFGTDVGDTYRMRGLVDGVRVYNRELSAAEVSEHYKGAFRDETGLVGRWDFDEGQGATAYDWSGGGNNAALVGNPAYTAQLPGHMLGFVLSTDNIVGGWSIQLGGKRNRFNRVKARFFNKDASWQPDFAVYEDTTHRTQDANQVLEQTLDLPFTRNYYTAVQIAQIEEKRSRFGTLVSVTATIAATCLEVGDVVPINHATPGWPAAGDPAEGKLFRVIEMELLSSDEVRLTLLEYSAAVYSLATPAQVVAPAATSLPDLSSVAAPGAPSVSETLYQTATSAGFKSRATITWAAANDSFVQKGGWYQLERSPAGGGSWTVYGPITTPGGGIATVSYVQEDIAPASYDFRVAAFNSIGAKSAYSPTTTKEILGLNAAPSNVANFAVQSYSGQAKLTWDKPSTATDLAVVQAGRFYVRWSPKTSGAAWDYGSLVNPDGYPGDTSIGFGPLMTGTYMAKMWNGKTFSVTEAVFVVTEALLTGLSSLATVTESPAFAGAKSNVAAVSGGIQLDGTTTIDAMLTNIDTWSAIDSLGGVQGSGSYTFSNTLDLGSKQVSRLFSSIDSLAYATDDMVDSRTDPVDSWGLVDGVVIEDAEVSLWTRHTDDDPAGAPVWSSWERLGLVADYNFRAFQFRLDFATGSPTHNRTVTALSVTAKH